MGVAAILVEHGRFVEAAPEVVALAPSSEMLVATPIIVTDAGAFDLAQMQTVPGVIAITPIDALQMGLLLGIDWSLQLHQGLLDQFYLGGVVPGADYPAVYGEPQGVVAPYAVPGAVNLSLTPANDDLAPTLPSDAINHATRSLAERAIPVLAAGNRHTLGAKFETISPWAEPEWVVAVGATVDESGETEWSNSARGTASRPDVGPDLLAWGQNPYRPKEVGTSFAAGRVSRMAVWTHAWLLQVVANIDLVAGRQFGVPLVGAVIVDRFFAEDAFRPPAFDWPALPVLATSAGALEELSPNELNELGELLSWPRTHRATRVLLQAAARASTPTPAIALSAPALTRRGLATFLDGLTVQRLMALLGIDARVADAAGDRRPVFPTGTVERLVQFVTASQPVWIFDIDKRRARTRRATQEAGT